VTTTIDIMMIYVHGLRHFINDHRKFLLRRSITGVVVVADRMPNTISMALRKVLVRNRA
jgi:hypothetical protein